jgi:hypothetical protein
LSLEDNKDAAPSNKLTVALIPKNIYSDFDKFKYLLIKDIEGELLLMLVVLEEMTLLPGVVKVRLISSKDNKSNIRLCNVGEFFSFESVSFVINNICLYSLYIELIKKMID